METTSPSTERPSILVVDDSNLLRGILREELEAEGWDVHLAEEGGPAVEMARDLRPDVILLDVVLPDKNGYEVCRAIKGDDATSDIPIVMLSSRNELKDKLAGFEAGADDYLAKPFFTKELLARLRTNLRVRDALESSRRLGQFYLEMLFGIGSAITSPFKVEDEVDIILRQALVAVHARRGSILLLDPEQGDLTVKGVHGYGGRGGPAYGERFRISDKLPLLAPDAPDAPLGIRMYEDSSRKTVFVPMVAKERLTGGIEIDLEGRDRRFSANDQKLLYALASQAAIFIENARLERDVRSMFLSIIVSMASAVDAKDAYTHGHSLRVARVGLLLAQELGLSRDLMEPLLLAGILHDVGKIAIPDEILKKPQRLDKEQMRDHEEATRSRGRRCWPAHPGARGGHPGDQAPPRELGRHRLSGRPRRGEHPPGGAPDPDRRRFRRDDHGPRVPEGDAGVPGLSRRSESSPARSSIRPSSRGSNARTPREESTTSSRERPLLSAS